MSGPTKAELEALNDTLSAEIERLEAALESQVVVPESNDLSVTSVSGRTVVTVYPGENGGVTVHLVRDGRQVDRMQLNRELDLNKED